jgi:hypothetical protein
MKQQGKCTFSADTSYGSCALCRSFVHSTIRIKGSEVIPVPLFNALDGKNSNDYIARVEPSAAGGRKMAEFLLDIIDSPSGTLAAENRVNAPTTGLMSQRK